MWKRYIRNDTVNLTNIAVPSLIANDLVVVHPLTSYSGSVAYLKYVSKTTKGGVTAGDEFNSVFGLGQMTDARKNFTSQVIVESGAGPAALNVKADGLVYEDDGAVKRATYKSILADGSAVYGATIDVSAVKFAYVSEEFQMEQVPALDIPTIGPKMEHIALVAEPRRIAVRYDQITAFQA